MAFQRPNQTNIAVSLSVFFDNDPLSIPSFYSFLTDTTIFTNTFKYYFTAGTSLEESTYLLQAQQLDGLLKGSTISENVSISFYETPHANHITNYWVSLPPILMDAFASYNSILNRWFHEKRNATSADVPVQQFKAELEQSGQIVGINLNPSLTQIFSLASHFAYEKNEYDAAIDFLELGIEFYPDYLDLYVEMIEFYKVQNNKNKIAHYKKAFRDKAEQSMVLSSSEKEKIVEYLKENED